MPAELRRLCTCEISSLTFCLLGGIEPGACSGVAGGVGVQQWCIDPGGGHKGRPELSHQGLTQQRSQQVIHSHNWNRKNGGEVRE